MIPFGNRFLVSHLAVAAVFAACATAARPARADSSYQESSQITGGVLKDQMTSNPLMARMTGKMFAATSTTTMVHGNQKAVVRPESIEIWDLDAQTISHVDKVKKTYWVVTFAEMRQAMSKAMGQANQPMPQAQTPQPQSNLKTTFQVAVNNTGVTKPVNGVSAQEQVITMTVTVTDTSQPQSPSQNPAVFVVTNDMWVALEDLPELKEIHDFDLRMEKAMMQGVDLSAMMAEMNQAREQSGQLLANQPGAAAALAQMGRQIATLKGTRVMTVTSVGGNAPAGSAAQAPSSAQAPASDAGSQQGSVLPGRLGSMASMIGGFHKKQPAQQPAPATTTPSAGSSGGSNVVLMQTTEQMSNFSEDPIPASVFQVPGGYSRVPSPYAQMSHY